jgi:hypothetical protein
MANAVFHQRSIFIWVKQIEFYLVNQSLRKTSYHLNREEKRRPFTYSFFCNFPGMQPTAARRRRRRKMRKREEERRRRVTPPTATQRANPTRRTIWTA